MTFQLQESPLTWFDPNFFPPAFANDCFHCANNLEGWKKNTVGGYPLSRETLVFASDDIIEKLQSGELLIPEIWGLGVMILPFPDKIREMKELIEKQCLGWEYNIALGNRYLRSKDKIAFHSDNEEFGNTQSIASVSLGVTRTFMFRSKNTEERHSLDLESGSFLFMGENCQENYIHGMKKEKIEEHEVFGKTRINITFRVWKGSCAPFKTPAV
jgi:alkylated DNA repair dioxygenase AlkB